MIGVSNTFFSLFFLVFLMNIRASLSQYNKPWSDKYESNTCAKLYPKNFINYAPVGKYQSTFLICKSIIFK